jgi:hypothetical protein
MADVHTGADRPGTTATDAPESAAETRAETAVKVPLFGARGRARELAAEVDRLRAEIAASQAEAARLRAVHERLGVLDVVALEQRRDELQADVARLGEQLRSEREHAEAAVDRELAAKRTERDHVAEQLRQLRTQVVVTEETALLQEVGVYEYRHPLSDSVAYQAELKRLRDEIKAMTRKDGGAVLATTDWTVNGSAAQGRTMVRDFSKLLLRAYNAEADNLVRGLKPYKLATAIERLTKVAATIEKLGRTMDIRIAAPYHRLRTRELELTADYVEKLAQEKEREREERERLREERKAQQEMERERARLEKERQHFVNALAALEAKGDEEAARRLREQLADVDRAIDDVDYRAANARAGYVYVISNLGSFGERIVKVGMTRRLDPHDRVRELGDASVPFRYDVHALFFAEDAVGIETAMHQRLADRRVNRVNLRREFFYATPQEVKEHLAELAGELLQFEELPEALEYRQSITDRGDPITSTEETRA